MPETETLQIDVEDVTSRTWEDLVGDMLPDMPLLRAEEVSPCGCCASDCVGAGGGCGNITPTSASCTGPGCHTEC